MLDSTGVRAVICEVLSLWWRWPHLCFLQSGEARAQFFTGHELKHTCDFDSQRGYPSGVCTGFIIGLRDTSRLAYALNIPHRIVCVPDGVDTSQLVPIVKSYLQSHPEELHKAAAVVAALAISAKFPCK